MLLELQGRHLRPITATSRESFIGRICEQTEPCPSTSGREIFLQRTPSETLPPGYRAYLLCHDAPATSEHRDVYRLARPMHYLAHEDVVRLDPQRGAIYALYRRTSSYNSLLVTEQCDNYCVMCSQPPKAKDDAWLLDELRQIVPLISPETQELGITGGEPALLGEGLVELLQLLEQHLPRTAIHVLSNGRRFSRADFARGVAKVGHPDLVFGIPLYSDVPEDHDYVVQARGAFSETIRGILNLKRYRVGVEIRFVVHTETYRRLPDFARFLARNLLFADHVAIMGLELMGFARANLDALWIDPIDYQGQLVEAVTTLHRAGMAVSIYNHPLCLLDPSLHGFARKSISDWKNTYLETCNACARKSDCGGFFASSSLRRSRGVRPQMS
ncbi:His-Xaa-Ser system radical SAM maturase HxsC [Pendulispora brunnea]|uniref:His-Xaa-Ser system radical SAM maturase HxsC n=1 Tax=Pendulispora brunnea TaxID=2905690 RepID=A0ABZ2JY50_9BACT